MKRPSIAMVVPDPQTACAHYRSILPLRHCAGPLADEGIDLVMPPPGQCRSDEHDAFIFYRAFTPEMYPFVTYLHALGKRVYWDTDDNLRAVPAWSKAAKSFKPVHHLIMEQCLASAHGVSVTTRPLANALNLEQGATVLPNMIDPADWPRPRDRHPGHCVIMWQGSNTHEEDIRLVVPALRAVRKEFGNRVTIALCGYCPEWLSSDATIRPVVFGLWPMASHPGIMSMLAPDINLCPLSRADSDRPFNECKSAIKFYEGTMAGAVTLATVGNPYGDAIKHAESGHLVEEYRDDDGEDYPNGVADAWTDSLVAAVHDVLHVPDERKDKHLGISQLARLKVLAYHSWGSKLGGGHLWLDYFRKIANEVA